ncbi:unnamed protein product [Linum tenue]|uniref:Transposase n=3 Tax=Linum tenue TaxID=586396 RepID=A0AAV0RN03_9ROSI|nr:unnamed protein product [Linum tenue]
MDKSWMRKKKFSVDYIEGVRSFISFVEEHIGHDNDIYCPCKSCLNVYKEPIQGVFAHLMINGIDHGYTTWVYHGESSNSNMDNTSDIGVDNPMEGYEDFDEELFDLLDEHQNFIYSEATNGGNFTNKGYEEYADMLGTTQEELYPNCTKYSKFSFIVKMLHLKVYNKWSNKSFDMLLKLLQDVLPEDNLVPKSFYEAKSMLRSLGLGYIPIHACRYDCALYWKENEFLEACPVCSTSRWKIDDGKGKKIPWKLLRYFPLKPRLRRLYMSSKTAAEMRWHKDKCNDDDGWLRHPADSKEWKDFDLQFPSFAEDARNIRLGLASDGFNPFGNMSNSYSMWPVVLTPYNLPPWMCMKEPYLFLTLLIPGPTAPGKDIDIYMQPLIDELKELWSDGIQTFDTHSKSNFQLHAAVLWTINDFPAYGNLSGWSTKGYLACPVCNKDGLGQKLKSKIGYLGHRRFLPIRHRWRKDKKFNGKRELRGPPSFLLGDDVMEQLRHVTERLPGKHPKIVNKRKRPSDDLNWVKQSIFFTLPYWEKLKLRHNLDVMHIEKNICDNVVGTLLNMPGKTKDTVKARQDLQEMNIRDELHLQGRSDGKYEMPIACYTMTKEERRDFCQFLREVKFPDGYASNISRCANVSEGKLTGLKSHDCHVLLQRLLPVGVRGSMDERVSSVLAELGDFFHRLCCKTLREEAVSALEADIITILCKLEMIYPPAFFDVMVHLAVHLPHELKIGGPVQYRWMYPIERYLNTLKGFVRNRAHPEGSIAEAYLVDECLTFCSMYLDGIETQFNALERNFDIEVDGKLSVFSSKLRPLGHGKPVTMSVEDLDMVHWYVLSNCEEVLPYLEEHLDSIDGVDPTRKQEIHRTQFSSWFKKRITNALCSNRDDEKMLALHALSCRPSNGVVKYTGCIINGVRFHTRERESRLKTQNSGIVVEGNHLDEVIDFYGVLVDIVRLDYVRDKQVILFKCEWFDVDRRKSRIMKDGAITSIKVDRLWYSSDPYILATQAKQIFYINDPKLGSNWRVVQRLNHRHIFSGDIESVDILDDDDIVNDDVAYQDDELTDEASTVVNADGDVERSLHRAGVVAEVIDQVVVEGNKRDELDQGVEEDQDSDNSSDDAVQFAVLHQGVEEEQYSNQSNEEAEMDSVSHSSKDGD